MANRVILGRLGIALAEKRRVESARLMGRFNFSHSFCLSSVEEACNATLTVKVSVAMSDILSCLMLCLNKLTEGGIEG